MLIKKFAEESSNDAKTLDNEINQSQNGEERNEEIAEIQTKSQNNEELMTTDNEHQIQDSESMIE